jgi:hypothetical protein
MNPLIETLGGAGRPARIDSPILVEAYVTARALGPLHVLVVGAGVWSFCGRHTNHKIDFSTNTNVPPLESAFVFSPLAVPVITRRYRRLRSIIFIIITAIPYIIIKGIELLRKHSG